MPHSQQNWFQFNELLSQQAIDDTLELYIPHDLYVKIKENPNLNLLNEDYLALITAFGFTPNNFEFLPTLSNTYITKSGKNEESIYFRTGDKFIQLFDQDSCNFDVDQTIKDFKNTGLIKLQSRMLVDRFFFFSNVENLDKLVIGCGHNSLVIQNCKDKHDDSITVDACASAYPDYVINVEKPNIPKLNKNGFKSIELEGVSLPLSLNLCNFLLQNLADGGVVKYSDELLINRADLIILHNLFEAMPVLRDIPEENIALFLKGQGPRLDI